MKRVILDTSVWISGLLRLDPPATQLLTALVNEHIEVIISSYGIVEVLTVFRRLAQELRVSAANLERDIWAIWNHPNVIKEFSADITAALLSEVRQQREIRLLAQILVLEPKDIPFIVLAYSHKLPLITNDERSLWANRANIETLTGVRVLLSKEWSL